MKWEVSGVKDGKPGHWRLDASSGESARRKAAAAGVMVSGIRAIDALPAKVEASAEAAVVTRRAVHAEIVDMPPAPIVGPAQILACENCGAPIGRLETPHVWQGNTVCGACHGKLSGEVARPLPAPAPAPAGLTMEQLAVLSRAAAPQQSPAVTHVHVLNQSSSTAIANTTVRRGCLGTIFRMIYLIVMGIVAVILFGLAYLAWTSTHGR